MIVYPIMYSSWLLQLIFRTPLNDFNILIHLHKRHLPRYHQAIDCPASTSSSRTTCSNYKHLPVVDFDPVMELLHELEVRRNSGRDDV